MEDILFVSVSLSGRKYAEAHACGRDQEKANDIGEMCMSARLPETFGDRCRPLRTAKKAAMADTTPPLDGRKVKKPLLCRNRVSIQKRSLVVNFLTELWHTVSEPMPTANKHYDVKDSKLKNRKRGIDALETGGKESAAVKGKLRFRRTRGRRPSQVVAANRGKDVSQLRLLPPGSYSDYLKLFHVKNPGAQISLKLFVKAACHHELAWKHRLTTQQLVKILRVRFFLAPVMGFSSFVCVCVLSLSDPAFFTLVVFNGPLPNAFLIPAVQIKCSKVWSVSFGTRLALREASSHAQCATCVRYKLLVRKLSNDSTARAQQLKEFEWHLAKQFADRACYWQNRATARLPMAPEASGPTISIITDAIDHNKVSVSEDETVVVEGIRVASASRNGLLLRFDPWAPPPFCHFGTICSEELELVCRIDLPQPAPNCL